MSIEYMLGNKQIVDDVVEMPLPWGRIEKGIGPGYNIDAFISNKKNRENREREAPRQYAPRPVEYDPSNDYNREIQDQPGFGRESGVVDFNIYQL